MRVEGDQARRCRDALSPYASGHGYGEGVIASQGDNEAGLLGGLGGEGLRGLTPFDCVRVRGVAHIDDATGDLLTGMQCRAVEPQGAADRGWGSVCGCG